MPHKEALAAHVDQLIGAAALIGAVNVVRRESDGRLVGANTDGAGFVIGCIRSATLSGGMCCRWARAGPGERWPSPWPGRARPA